MRRTLTALAAAALLGGCVSILEDAYDDQAERACREHTDPDERRACLDRVEEHRRSRD